MKSLSVAVASLLILIAAPFRTDAATITGSISGPSALGVGELGSFTFDYTLGNLPAGSITLSDTSLVFHFGDGNSENFNIATGSNSVTFTHSYLSAGSFIPTVSDSVSGVAIRQSCSTIFSSTICIPVSENFSATADINGTEVGVTEAAVAMPAPGAALFLVAGVGALALRRKQTRA